MTTIRTPSFALVFCAIQFFSGFCTGVAADWPAGYEVLPDSESPDGRYGVLLPTPLVADALADKDIKNTLVDLKANRRVAVIRGAKYFPGQMHHDLTITWAESSRWCASVYNSFDGFESITLVEPHGAKCKQTDLGPHIQNVVDAAIARQAKGKKLHALGTAYFREGPGHQVLVRAHAETNSKTPDDLFDFRAIFQGTFDPASGKWTRSEAQKVVSCDPFAVAYGTSLDEGLTFIQGEDKLAWFNKHLNQVYEAVQIVLPEKRLAPVKEQQTAWLKQLEALGSVEEKCKLIGARIQELRKLVW